MGRHPHTKVHVVSYFVWNHDSIKDNYLCKLISYNQYIEYKYHLRCLFWLYWTHICIRNLNFQLILKRKGTDLSESAHRKAASQQRFCSFLHLYCHKLLDFFREVYNCIDQEGRKNSNKMSHFEKETTTSTCTFYVNSSCVQIYFFVQSRSFLF